MKKKMDYFDLVRRHAVFMALVQHGSENWLSSDIDVEPRQKLTTEKLPVELSEVPQKDIEEALMWLRERGNQLEHSIKKYGFVEMDYSDDDDDPTQKEVKDGKEGTGEGSPKEDGAKREEAASPPQERDAGSSKRGKRTPAVS